MKMLPNIKAEDKIVYVRAVNVSELPDDIREQAADMSDLYGVFGPNGEQIAVTPSRALAFDLARHNALKPMSVH